MAVRFGSVIYGDLAGAELVRGWPRRIGHPRASQITAVPTFNGDAPHHHRG